MGEIMVFLRLEYCVGKVKRFITVEPVLILFALSAICSMSHQAYQNEKACFTKLDYDHQICEFMSKFENDMLENPPRLTLQGFENVSEFLSLVEKAKEESVAEIRFLNSYSAIPAGIIQLLVLLFVGGWSDRVRLRKPCILLPIFADTLNYVVHILGAVYMREIPLEVAGILPSVIESLCGGYGLLLTGIYSYLTACTEEKDRTFHFACTTVIYSVIPIVALFFSGHIYFALGFTNVFFIGLMLNTSSLLYGLFILKEPHELPGAASAQDSSGALEQSAGFTLRQLFDFDRFIDCVKVLIRKRDFNRRNILYVILAVSFINYGALHDVPVASDVAYYKFHWLTDLGIWQSYDALTTMLGTILVISILSKRLRVSDAMICVFSVCFSMVGKLIMIAAVTTITPSLYYVATSIDLFESSRTVSIRSAISKMVGPDEIGKVQAVLGVVQAAQAIVYPSLFNTVYLKTKEHFLGSVFLLAEAFLLTCLVLYVMLFLMSRRSERVKASVESTSKKGADNPALDMSAL